VRRQGSAGRPWGPLRGPSSEDSEVASIMRGLVDHAGITVGQIRAQLTPDMFGGRPVPSLATLSKRFAGEGLRNNGALVRAVVTLCASPGEVEVIQRQVGDLLGRAWARDLGDDGDRREAARKLPDGSRSDASAEIHQLRAELLRERELRHRSELTTAVLVGLLAGRTSGATGAAESASMTAETPTSERDERVMPVELVELARSVAVEFQPEVEVSQVDEGLSEVFRWFRQQDPTGVRVGSAIRAAMDEALDGPNTGRYSLSQLDKYERTFLGHHIRRAFRRAFGLAAGEDRDFSVQGVDFDLHFSVRRGGWMIREDQLGKIVLLVYGSEDRGVYGAGLCRVADAVLAGKPNRDRKDMLRRQALESDVIWLASEAPLRKGILLRLPPEAVQSVFGKPTSGQRIEELVRQSRGEIVEASAFATAAMQTDALKRVRDARQRLAAEGLLVLGGGDPTDQLRAQELGFRSLARDEYAIAVDS
jgi:hypothetical protein